METRANYALVGLFTLAVLAACFGFVYWFRAANHGSERLSYRVVFTGSVSGLSKGSSVRFNGLRVGEVTAVELLPDDLSRVAAYIEVDRTTPVRTDTRARLEYQGLTGVASVHLSGVQSSAPPLTNPDGKGAPTIFADRSDFQDLFETAQRLAGRIDSIVTRMDKILADGEAPFNSTLRNIEGFSRALNDNSPGMSAFLAQMTTTAQRFALLSDRFDRLVEGADEILRGLDRQSLNRSLANFESFSKTLGDNKTQIEALVGDAASLAKRLNEAAPKLDAALGDASSLMKSIDGARLNAMVADAEKFAKALGAKAGDVETALGQVAEITRKVNQSADRLDSVMKAAEDFLTDKQGRSVMVEIGETAKSIRTLANNLDKRTGEITAGINRFTGPGLRELETLTSDARKAVNDVGRAVRSLERNPQQLITGGRSSIPEYSGSR
ncbi:MAG TPA: MlaD family protein [Beijerinckiaceae bacterium]|nr:MlaD family protein [Beijerinckiaceae bacterium]